MSSHVILNIFIGLILVYVIYSLFATILMEIIATTFALRARNMKVAILRMLSDGIIKEDDSETDRIWYKSIWSAFCRSTLIYYPISIWKQFIDFFKDENQRSKTKDLYRLFFRQPLIARLSSGRLFSKPSYMKAETFSKGLLDSLKELGGEGKPIDQVKNGIEALEDNEKTKKLLKSFLNDANNDLEKFKLLLENWFDNTMERIIGWYRRKNQAIVLILGFCIATIFNVNTISIVKKLSKDEKARELMVEMATAYVKENEELINTVKKLDEEKDSIMVIDTLSTKLDSLTKIQQVLRKDIDEANTILGLDILHIPDSFFCVTDTIARCDSSVKAVKDNNSTAKSVKDTLKLKNTKTESSQLYRLVKINDTTKIFVYIPKQFENIFSRKSVRLKKKINSIKSHGCGYLYPKRRHIFFKYHWRLIRNNFFGLLLTTLAISLGAPFWFDLLNKLVNLRTSLQEPVEKIKKSKKSNTTDEVSPLNRKG